MRMFKRRDIPPVLLLLLLIILVMLTLSQILVVHNGRYGRNVHNMRKLQLELREMDLNLHSLMMRNVPSIELNRRLLQNQINTARFAEILDQASKPDPKALATKRRREEMRRGLPMVSQEGVAGTMVGTQDTDSNARTTIDVTPEQHSASTHPEGSPGPQPQGHISGSFNKSLERTSPVWAEEPSNSADIPGQGAQPIDETSGPISTAYSAPALTGYFNSNSIWSRRSNGTAARPKKQLKYCPSIPPTLRGGVFINLTHRHNFSLDEIIRHNPNVQPGGQWRPVHCTARHKVAIVVPYRDRLEHLTTLLAHLHPVLQRQQLDYRVYVVEQYGKDTFNKARIMNIAFVEALKQYGFQCFVFHDVDLVPEDDRNMYSCPTQPRHMSVAIDEMGYKLAYQELVGGVLNMRTEHFQRVNGYSNLYWGWGAEDDDMAYRIMHVGLKITRPPENVARYKMAPHTKRKPSDWRKRLKLLYTGTRRFQFDGLNSLQYKLVHIKKEKLYTHVLVNIGKPPKGF